MNGHIIFFIVQTQTIIYDLCVERCEMKKGIGLYFKLYIKGRQSKKRTQKCDLT